MNALNAKLDGKELRIEHSGISNSSSLSSFSPQAVSTPNLTPDHKVDRKTKMMYLTDDGRKQVLQRKASFDFRRCVNRGNRSVLPSSYEIPFLVTFLAQLSRRYSDSKFVQWMRFHRHSSRLAGILSHVFLAPPPPRYVPVYSKTIVPRLPQLNLRFMASYYFVFSFLFVILFLLGSLYRIVY
uniref:Uncharacterized protein n=1 Tax=Panagrolaimus sp. JU765 TaxID=591449 RepID=A0AC34QZ20_9BILA